MFSFLVSKPKELSFLVPKPKELLSFSKHFELGIDSLQSKNTLSLVILNLNFWLL